VARGSGCGEGIKIVMVYIEHMTAERQRGWVCRDAVFISDTAEVI
jgi:hypothetical protein